MPFYTLWGLFSLVPAYAVVDALLHGDVANAALYATGIAGAFGLAYAPRNLRADNLRQAGLCLLTVGAIFLLPMLLTLVLPIHLHVGEAGQTAAHARPALASGLISGLKTFLWGVPAGFLIEEVFFRGGLDSYLHRNEEGTGWLSAIFVSAVLGLWHLPGSARVAICS